MLYLVTYTLNPKRDATKILTALQHVGEWWHYLDDTWLISTQETANQLYNRVAPSFFNTDRILIVQITPNATTQGWLTHDAWEWLKQRRLR